MKFAQEIVPLTNLEEKPCIVKDDIWRLLMISVKAKGNFKNTDRFLDRMKKKLFIRNLDEYGRKGVIALASATPVDTGKTANSWDYRIEDGGDWIRLVWTNSNVVNGVNIAIILQYGHGTKNGGYVQGRDYINPALQPLFDEIAESAWAEVIGT